jgi:hypothetical protein
MALAYHNAAACAQRGEQLDQPALLQILAEGGVSGAVGGHLTEAAMVGSAGTPLAHCLYRYRFQTTDLWQADQVAARLDAAVAAAAQPVNTLCDPSLMMLSKSRRDARLARALACVHMHDGVMCRH